jgi:hypothetical protein
MSIETPQRIIGAAPGATASPPAKAEESAAAAGKSLLFPRVPDPGNIFRPAGEGVLPVEGIIGEAVTGGRIPWRAIARPAIRSLLELSAAELELPLSMLGEGEMTTPLQLLGGRALNSLYDHVNRHPERNGRNIIALIQDTVGIEVAAADVVEAIRKGKRITWRLVPQEAAAGILRNFASSLDVPPSMLTYDNLASPSEFLQGGSLNGMLKHSSRHTAKGGKEIAFILQDLGFAKNAEDIVTYTRSQANSAVWWKQVSWQEVHKLLKEAATELGVPVNMLVGPQLTMSKFDFLGGGSLKGLFGYWARHPEKMPGETSMQFMRRNLGLPNPRRGSQAKFRYAQLVQQAGRNDDVLTAFADGQLSPWVSKMADLYSRSHENIELHEIENEIVLFLHSEAAWGIQDHDTLLGALHTHLEAYAGNVWTRWYREKSLAAPQRNSKLSLADKLEAAPMIMQTDVKLSPQLGASLAKLTPLQREVVLRVTVDGESFKAVADKLEMDIDTLAEQYDDALATMRAEMADGHGRAA